MLKRIIVVNGLRYEVLINKYLVKIAAKAQTVGLLIIFDSYLQHQTRAAMI